ncbi:hypothetical protein MYX07_00380 [Patescibacteria group bacterium AH-259-L07]|nr:hypothetical protein [Patescibacteria group bacterium AH-259-L07]
MENSKKYSLNSIDWKKIGTGLLIALGGAFATYLEELIPSIDFQSFTPLVVAINSIIINTIRKFLTGLK